MILVYNMVMIIIGELYLKQVELSYNIFIHVLKQFLTETISISFDIIILSII